MIIGLTGQIGAGKSSAARIFTRLGVTVIDADKIGRQVVGQSVSLRRQLAASFGSEILDRNGKLKRKKLAQLAFADESSRAKLNRLVHPHLLKELRKQVRSAKKKSSVVVIDAALLLNWEMDREVDLVLVIEAPKRIRMERLEQRGIDRQDALARQRLQFRSREFRKRADIVIINNGALIKVEAEIGQLLASIQHK